MFRISKFINDSSFQLYYQNNSLDIINYDYISYMEDNKISIIFNKNSKLLINGLNLTVKKLLDSEILISGLIEKVEFINELL